MVSCTYDKSVESSLFIKAQLNAIDKSKYIESEKKHRDLFFDEKGKPSQDFYLWWVNQHAEEFRKAWPNSICKKCSKIFTCKDCLKESCPQFNEGWVNWMNSLNEDESFHEDEITLSDEGENEEFKNAEDEDLKELDFES